MKFMRVPKMTYREIAEALTDIGDTFADTHVAALMDSVEEYTGIFPDWDEIPPDWLLAESGISKRRLEAAKQPA